MIACGFGCGSFAWVQCTGFTDADGPGNLFLDQHTKYMGHEHKYMGHEIANWGGRGLDYMLFNVHLCNQPYYCKVVVGPGHSSVHC